MRILMFQLSGFYFRGLGFRGPALTSKPKAFDHLRTCSEQCVLVFRIHTRLRTDRSTVCRLLQPRSQVLRRPYTTQERAELFQRRGPRIIIVKLITIRIGFWGFLLGLEYNITPNPFRNIKAPILGPQDVA